MSPPWFALRVRPKHERTASLGLRTQGFDEYLPLYRVKRRWSDRVKEMEGLLFPGYIFCRFTFVDRLRVLNSPGIRSIVGFGKTETPVADSEIAAIRTILSTGRCLEPWPYIRIGQSVVIERGPLAGLRGVVVREKESWRVVVSVEALDRSVAVEVDRDAVAPE
jgi:transcription antitermination factor NusG